MTTPKEFIKRFFFLFQLFINWSTFIYDIVENAYKQENVSVGTI